MAWRVVRVVDGAALEMLCTAMYLRFESVTLRHLPMLEWRKTNMGQRVQYYWAFLIFGTKWTIHMLPTDKPDIESLQG